MKNLLLIASIILVYWSCTAPVSEDADVSDLPPEGEEQIQLVENYIDALLSKDLTTMESMLSEDYMGYGPAINDSSDRAQTIETWKTNWDSVYTSIEYEIVHRIFTNSGEGRAAGDWVSEWGIVTANYIDGSESVTFWFNGVYRVTDGKIDRSRGIYDTGDIMEQQGFEFVPPGGESDTDE